MDHWEIEGNFTKLNETIFGNGKPGLKTDVEIMKEKISKLDEIEKDVKSNSRAIWAIGGGLAILNIVLQLLKH